MSSKPQEAPPNAGGVVPLEAVLEALVDQVTAAWPPPRVAAARHLVALDEPLTISGAAERYGGSRETARRAGQRLAAGLRKHAANERLVEHPAVRWLTAYAPVDLGEAAAALFEANLLLDGDGLARVLRVMDVVGVHLSVRLSPDGRRVQPTKTGFADVALAAGRGLRHGAPVPLDTLVETLTESGFAATPEELRVVLREFGVGRLLPSDSHDSLVVAAGDDPDAHPVPRLLRRVLAVTGSLPVPSLLAAWQRQSGLATFVPLPTDAVALRAWLGALRGFVIDSEGVRVTEPERVPLDRTTAVLAGVLADHPEGMGRMDLLDACAAADLAPASAAAALAYHPMLAHADHDLWQLRRGPAASVRGHCAGPCDSPGTRGDRRTRRTHGTRAASYTWSPTGALVLRAVFTGSPSPVLHIPAAIREIVADRTFTLRIAGSLPEGSVGSLRARGSNAWGFGPLLRTAGIHRYDVFEIHCDLTTGVAVLQRADDEEMSGG